MPDMSDHRKISDTFLEQAQREYIAGDLLQASEKAWGAVAHYVMARSDDCGWPSGTHKQLLQNARKLGGDSPYLLRLFNSVRGLHVNFYQDMHDRDSVLLGIRDAKELLSILKRREADSRYEFVPAEGGFQDTAEE